MLKIFITKYISKNIFSINKQKEKLFAISSKQEIFVGTRKTMNNEMSLFLQ